jgi:hypothetical protein
MAASLPVGFAEVCIGLACFTVRTGKRSHRFREGSMTSIDALGNSVDLNKETFFKAMD